MVEDAAERRLPIARGLTKWQAMRVCNFMNGGGQADPNWIHTVLTETGNLEV